MTQQECVLLGKPEPFLRPTALRSAKADVQRHSSAVVIFQDLFECDVRSVSLTENVL